jgi:hypothetical protein
MAFVVNKLAAHCITFIRDFAKAHADETFYAFAIDASMICLSSVEKFEEILKKYQDRWLRETRPISSMAEMTEKDHEAEKFGLDSAERYLGLDRKDDDACLAIINENRTRMRAKGCVWFTEDGIQSLKFNTGDWAYQGFADLKEEHGFDHELYDDHYNDAMDAEDGHAPQTEYAIAMTDLVTRLKESDAFAPLKTTSDFIITWVDHDY